MKKPNVILKCPANQHTAANERIIEFSSEYGGGLISFRANDGVLHVEVYRTDKTVRVTAPKE